jgi:glycerophosphoryl diester phosphodiesterase
MLIYAHRGSSGTLPENTLAAFARALADGADGVELDLRCTADRVPVVLHDRAFDRTTNGHGNVDELTLAELRAFDAGGGEPVPTLADVLDLLAGRLPLDLEVKQVGIEREVLAVLARYPHADWAISAFDWDVLRAFRRLDPTTPTWPLAIAADDALFAVSRDLAAPVAVLMSSSYTPDSAARFAAAGLAVAVWTVNDVAEARRVRDLGAHALATDFPAEIRAGLIER